VIAKPVVLRQRAHEDLLAAVDDLLSRGGKRDAGRFVGSFELACNGVARHPTAGSERFASQVGLPGLQHWEIPGSGYLIFYREYPDHVDVWRVLSADSIPSWMDDHR
jgi:toxin ParE1/3/4